MAAGSWTRTRVGVVLGLVVVAALFSPFVRPTVPIGSHLAGLPASKATEVPAALPTPQVVRSPPARPTEATIASRPASREVFPPSPPLSVDPSSGAPPSGGYVGNPAPMGIADLGRGAGGLYVYDTSGFMASVTFESPFSAYSPGFAAAEEAPNWLTFQLNAVAVNVSYPFATAGHYGTYWVQSVVHTNGTSFEFEDNLWNFTAPKSGMGGLTLESPRGIVTGAFYYRNGPTISSFTYPVTVDLYTNISLVAGHPTVYLNYSVADTHGPVQHGSYDAVTFLRPQATPTPSFQVNGEAANGAGHWTDAELIFGGDGAGSNANFLELNATAQLDYWNSSLAAYVSVPSAYDHGQDSGETSEGMAVTYTGTTADLVQGPSMLYGLWGTANSVLGHAAASGAVRVALAIDPHYGFAFATDRLTLGTPPIILDDVVDGDLAYFPTNATGNGTTELPPPAPTDPYEVMVWAPGYGNSSARTVTGAASLNVTLNATPAAPLSAPVYLSTTAQAAALGALGVPSVRYALSTKNLTIAPSADVLAPPFLRLNDFLFPTFVLFAADRLNVSVGVDGLAQAANASTYVSDEGTFSQYVGWSQGYFFFYGNGSFDVTNTTLPGNSTAYYDDVAYPPATVEFFGTVGSRASNVTSSGDAFGVDFDASTKGTASHLTSETGSDALDVFFSQGIVATDVAAVGADLESSPSLGAYLLNATSVRLTGFSAVNGSLDLAAGNASWTAIAVSAVNATAIEALNGSSSSVDGLSVADAGSSSFAGYWNESTDVSIVHLSVAGIGLELDDDDHVSVVGVNVSTLGSSGVLAFARSANGSFTYVNVTDESLGLNLSGGTSVSFASVVATDGSVGAYLLGTNQTVASGLTATDRSAALVWEYGLSGTVTDCTVSDASAGVVVTNVTYLNVSGVTANNATLGPASYVNPAMGFLLPDAAVALANDSNVSVKDVFANNYAYAVQAALTDAVALADLRAYDGEVAVELDTTNNTTVSSLFAFGQAVGVSVVDSTNVTLEASTLEASSSFGFAASNGGPVTVVGNNFVANRGASATGAFSAGHIQASVTGTAGATFASNYWSDAAGLSSYGVGGSVADTTPHASFYGSWLAFQETGLPSGTRWAVGVMAVLFGTPASLVYLPAWTVPSGSYAFLIPLVRGYVAYPAAGSVTFSGTNETVLIQFNSTSSASSPFAFPLWAIGAAAGAAIAVAAAAVWWLRRPRTEEPPRT